MAALVVAITAAACTSAPPTPTLSPAPLSPTAAVQGGTLRVVVPVGIPRSKLAAAAPEPGSQEPDPRLSVLDPHADHWYDAAELLRCCLARRLLSTNGRSTEEGGAELPPDVASSMPEISADGLAWAFRLKQGVRYGPPLVDVEVTAVDYAPYRTPEGAGDLVAARDEMAQSAYDADGDGVCDESVCQAVRALSRDPYGDIAEVVRDNLASLGIELGVETLPFNDFFAAFGDPTQHVGVFVPLGWAKSVLTPAEFLFPYHSLTGSPGSLVGSTPEQLEEWGYDAREVPSIDGRLDACVPLTGAQQFECWAALDQHIMETSCPWFRTARSCSSCSLTARSWLHPRSADWCPRAGPHRAGSLSAAPVRAGRRVARTRRDLRSRRRRRARPRRCLRIPAGADRSAAAGCQVPVGRCPGCARLRLQTSHGPGAQPWSMT
ncbi:MAG TPA: hypothetical protein VMP67_03975 [Candidatus Limnocylindria bacterium]|nr:hypothetical protein [Candidatus Limnocylindria bacterium]